MLGYWFLIQPLVWLMSIKLFSPRIWHPSSDPHNSLSPPESPSIRCLSAQVRAIRAACLELTVAAALLPCSDATNMRSDWQERRAALAGLMAIKGDTTETGHIVLSSVDVGGVGMQLCLLLFSTFHTPGKENIRHTSVKKGAKKHKSNMHKLASWCDKPLVHG